MIDGFVRLMDTPDSVTGPINLGNPVEFTIRELAERTIELTGSSSRISYKPLPHDDPRQRCPDISKAKDLLDWNPVTALNDGLLKTIQYFDNHLSGSVESPSLSFA